MCQFSCLAFNDGILLLKAIHVVVEAIVDSFVI